MSLSVPQQRKSKRLLEILQLLKRETTPLRRSVFLELTNVTAGSWFSYIRGLVEEGYVIKDGFRLKTFYRLDPNAPVDEKILELEEATKDYVEHPPLANPECVDEAPEEPLSTYLLEPEEDAKEVSNEVDEYAKGINRFMEVEATSTIQTLSKAIDLLNQISVQDRHLPRVLFVVKTWVQVYEEIYKHSQRTSD